jgi:hypothetical protein
VLVRIPIDRDPVDVLHDEVREAVRRGAAVDKRADVRVIERGQDLPLVPEAADDRLGVHAAADRLDRRLSLEGIVGAPRQVDRAHSPASDRSFDQIRAEALADIRIRGENRDRRDRRPLEERRCTGVSLQERFDVSAQRASTPHRSSSSC